MNDLNDDELRDISEILRRRANEIAAFHRGYTKDESHFGSVEMALSREIARLRRLADVVNPENGDEE